MMASFPKISIVTPSFNDAKFLETTIRSVLDQNYPNLEYIIVDGGSTDGSVEIIKKYADRLAWWVSEKDNGMYHAIHKGFEKTTGEIMGWINSDDMLHKGSLLNLAQIFSDFGDVNWVQGYPNTIDEQGRIVYVFSWPEISKLYFYRRDRDNWKYIQQESTYWRRSLWEKAGSRIETKYKFAGDFELWTRFFQHAKLHHLRAFIGSFRVSASGQASTENFQKYIAESNEILKSYPLTSREKRKLFWIQFFDSLDSFFRRIFRVSKRMLGLVDKTSSIDDIYFYNPEQKFKR